MGGSIVALVAMAQLLVPHVRVAVVVGLMMALNPAVRLPLPDTVSCVGFCVELDTPSGPFALHSWKEKPAAALARIV